MKTTSLFRFSATEQLALYQMFHQHSTNRLLHLVALPLVIYSGFLLLDLFTGSYAFSAPAGWPPSIPLNIGFCLLVGSLVIYTSLDKATTLAVMGWTLPLLLLSNWTVAGNSWWFLLSVGGVLQVLGWYTAVYWGHEQVEPLIEVECKWSSTNCYFKQHWYVLREVGRPPTRLDAWVQYSIGPFASTLDLLFALGYKPSWKQDIELLCDQKIHDLAMGKPLFEPLEVEQWER
jgi:uncharacterized membrane protein YGL010W